MNFRFEITALIMTISVGVILFLLAYPSHNQTDNNMEFSHVRLYHQEIDKNRMLFFQPDKFAIPSEIGFMPANYQSYFRIGSDESEKNAGFEASRIRTDGLDLNDSPCVLLLDNLLVSHQNKYLIQEQNVENKYVTNNSGGLYVELDSRLTGRGIIIPRMSFDFIASGVSLCRIKCFIRLDDKGSVCDVFVEDAEAPSDVIKYVVQRIYRSKATNVSEKVSGSVIVAWQK